MRRLRDESGVALPVAISILTIVLLMVGVAVAYSIHSLDRSNRDRANSRALAAADAGLDVAAWRMNKSIVAGQYSEILSLNGSNGLLNQVIQTLGCTNLSVSGSNIIGGQWCKGVTEVLDDHGGMSAGETFTYFSDLSIKADIDKIFHLNSNTTGLVTRNVVSVGTANGERAVVVGKLELDLNNFMTDLNFHLFTLVRYAQCSASSFDPNNPAANCPSI